MRSMGRKKLGEDSGQLQCNSALGGEISAYTGQWPSCSFGVLFSRSSSSCCEIGQCVNLRLGPSPAPFEQ